MLDFSKEDDDVSELSEFSLIHEDIVYRYLLVKLLVRAGFRHRH